MGRLDEAVAEYKKALSINPNHAKAHYNLGNAYLKEEDYRLAKTHYDKAMKLVWCLENSVLDFGNLTCHQKVTSIVENPNIEIRNPKQCQNPNVLNSKQKRFFTVVFCFGH